MHRNPTRMSGLRHGASALIVLALAFPAFAQDDDSKQGIDEIIVTATKREQSIQDVPIAVSAFTADELENRGIEELEDLNQISPSISVYNSNSTANGGTVRIRGVGTTGNNPGLESAVGMFIDGVYRSRSGQGFSDFVDVERIEVLRGPQGTLFGKNTVAGAVSVITKKPSFDFGGHVSATYGNLDQKRVAASVTGPVIDDVLAFRLSGSWREADGYYQDFNSTDAYGERDRYSLKGQLLWTPSEDLSVRLIADYTEKDESCCPAAFYGQGPSAAWIRQVGGTVVGQTGANGGPVDFFGPRNINADPREVGVNFKPVEEVEDWGVALDITYEWNEVTIHSITAYREYEAFRAQDVDFTDADVLRPQDADDLFENFSQEFQFIGSTGDLDWIVGIYGYTEDIDTDDEILFSAMGGPFVSLVFTAGASAAALAPAFPNGAGYRAEWFSETEGYAIYTNNTYHLTEQLDITFGIRYSRERKEAGGSVNGGLPGQVINDPTPGLVPGVGWCEGLSIAGVGAGRAALGSLCDNVSWENSATEREWTGTVSTSYAVSEELNVYASFSRGYKAGGFNLDQESFDSIINPALMVGAAEVRKVDKTRFEPEFVNAYELGFKSTWLDGNLVMNVALFISKFEDFQLNSFDGLGFTITNLSQVESRGFEVETFWAVNENLTLSVGATYADARYGDNLSNFATCSTPTPDSACAALDAPTGGNVNVPSQIDGDRLTYAPAWNGTFSANYEQTIPGTEWIGRFVWATAYRGRANTGSNLHPLKLVQDTWFQNARLTAVSPDGDWEIALWANNLTNEFVPMVVFDSVFQSGSLHTFVNEPRTFGLTVKYSFGEGS